MLKLQPSSYPTWSVRRTSDLSDPGPGETQHFVLQRLGNTAQYLWQGFIIRYFQFFEGSGDTVTLSTKLTNSFPRKQD
jgi:hypothetical protein